MEYDQRDRLTAARQRQFVHRSYDGNGNLLWTSHPAGSAPGFYDANNNMLDAIDASGVSGPDEKVMFTKAVSRP